MVELSIGVEVLDSVVEVVSVLESVVDVVLVLESVVDVVLVLESVVDVVLVLESVVEVEGSVVDELDELESDDELEVEPVSPLTSMVCVNPFGVTVTFSAALTPSTLK